MDFKTTALGIELGSTRIKAVLIDKDHLPIASGDFEWENQFVDGIWTYSWDAIRIGLQSCFADLKKDVKEKFGDEAEPLYERLSVYMKKLEEVGFVKRAGA